MAFTEKNGELSTSWGEIPQLRIESMQQEKYKFRQKT